MLSFGSRMSALCALACDELSANVMIADAGLNIVYVNGSLHKFLADSEAQLKAELPRFSMATLVGSNIDVFHKDPSHQRNMLARLADRHFATISVGRKAFDVIVKPLKRGGKTAGFVVEWADADVRLRSLDYAAQIAAIGRNQAIIEFSPTGVILQANARFLSLMGYTLEEIVGKRHAIFLDETYRNSREYSEFWTKLADGGFHSGQFERRRKDGRPVWIYGSYNPIPGPDGKIAKVVKFATDATDLVRSVQTIAGGLAALAQGRLDRKLMETLTPELDIVRDDFNRAVDNLRDTMRQMVGNARRVAERSGELRASSEDLSRRSESQAASLEESAAALNEVTATVQRTSQGADMAKALVQTAKAGAESASGVMQETVAAMTALENSSSQIARIIGAIDEIAFQTNLLALNAGVEAARAGEAGRGFAVVASEVRNLAQRAAEAAKEIKDLIADSNRHVQHGVELVGRTGAALEQIVRNVNEVTGVMNEIADSTKSQAISLKQVNDAIGDMNTATQQNATMAQQASDATGALTQDAAQVVDTLGRFDFGDGVRERRPAGPVLQAA